jgi:hypothetical protein
MPTVGLKISTEKPSVRFESEGRDFLIALQVWLQKTNGGTCAGLATATSITAEISGISREDLTPMLNAFVLRLSESGAGLQVLVNAEIVRPLSPELQEIAATFNLPPTKLTLKFFRTLPAGFFVASNLMTGRDQPVFAEPVAPEEARMEQWKQIQDCGAAQRSCHVFRTEDDFRRWINHRPR